MELNPVDKQYHDLLQRLVDQADQIRMDRTGTGTTSIFGHQMRFNLQEQFPILTTKNVHFKSVAVELMWFLKGDTNIKYLLENNVHIWTDWRYKAFVEHCKKMGDVPPETHKEFERDLLNGYISTEWGDIGKGYGHQWRNFGEVIKPAGTGVTPYPETVRKGFDQISWVINEIKTNPNSRRLIVSGWNPHEVNQVDLPPCHTLFQFFVHNGKLSCQLYQRSADVFLGVPFNIASYALLTHIIAQECGLHVGDFVWTGGDVHLYINHIEQAKTQLARESQYGVRPSLHIPHPKPFDQYSWDDFILASYNPRPTIKAPVAV